MLKLDTQIPVIKIQIEQPIQARMFNGGSVDS